MEAQEENEQREDEADADREFGVYRPVDKSQFRKKRSFSSTDLSFAAFRGHRVNFRLAVFCTDDTIRNSISWVLRLIGCRFVSAHERVNEMSANAVCSEAVDLVLCDMDIADALLTALKERYKDKEDEDSKMPHVVLICPKRFNKQLLAARLDDGASGYITMPMRIQSIRGVVVKYLKDGADHAPEVQASAAGHKSQYEKLQKIGSGSFGAVSLVRRSRDGVCFALKEIGVGRLSFPAQRRVLDELRLHRSFACPCIVRSYASWLQEPGEGAAQSVGDVACLLMEYVEAGSLSNQVVKSIAEGTEISDATILDWTGQMLIGLMYLHQKAVIHRDLKLDNVLGPNANGCVKLADFGVARELTTARPGLTADMSFVGTPNILAPERCAGAPGANTGDGAYSYGTESDIWSLGCIVYELAALKPPFEALKETKQDGILGAQFMESINSMDPPPLPFTRSADMHRLVIGGLLQKRPQDRPTVEQLVEEPMLGRAIYKFLERCNLLQDPSVLEVMQILPSPDASRSNSSGRLEVSQADVVSLHQQGGMNAIGQDMSILNVLEPKGGHFGKKKTLDFDQKHRPTYANKAASTTSLASIMTGVTEAEFQCLEKADDSLTRTTSLDTIKHRGQVENWLLDANQLKMEHDVLGAGAFGVVHRGQFYGSPVALKMPKADAEAIKHSRFLGNELRVLRHIRHPCIVAFYGACIDSSSGIVLALEEVEGSTLGRFIQNTDALPSTAHRFKILLDICGALKYLHAQSPRVVHGDLKDSNILVQLWRSGPQPKLLDFGLSRMLTKHVSPLGGTVSWMAPEVIRNRNGAPPLPSADVFSFGRLAYMIITGMKPLGHLSCDEILRATHSLTVPALVWPQKEVPLMKDCESLTQQCLQVKAMLRPDMEDLECVIQSWDMPKDSPIKWLESKLGMKPSDFTTWEDGHYVHKNNLSVTSYSSNVSTSSSSIGVKDRLKRFSMDVRSRFAGEDEKNGLANFMTSVNKRWIDSHRIKVMKRTTIEAGTFGCVVPVYMDGFLAAVHIPRGPAKGGATSQITDAMAEELQVLTQLKHPNVATLYGLVLDPDGNMIAPCVEWVEGEPLQDVVGKEPIAKDLLIKRRLLLDLCSALQYLHKLKPPIVHANMKGSNIIVEARLTGPRAKLLDCGLKRSLSVASGMHLATSAPTKSTPEWLRQSRRRSIPWIAPELFQRKMGPIAPSVDIFSMGRLIFLITTGRLPLENKDALQLEAAAKKGTVLYAEWCPFVADVGRYRLLGDRCLNEKPALRPNITEVQAEIKTWNRSHRPPQPKQPVAHGKPAAWDGMLQYSSESSQHYSSSVTHRSPVDVEEQSWLETDTANENNDVNHDGLMDHDTAQDIVLGNDNINNNVIDNNIIDNNIIDNNISEDNSPAKAATDCSGVGLLEGRRPPVQVNGVPAGFVRSPPCPTIPEQEDDPTYVWIGDDDWLFGLEPPLTSQGHHAVSPRSFRCPVGDDPTPPSMPSQSPKVFRRRPM